MLVQAQAATAVLHHDRDRAELALAAIAATGRELLIEIRRLLDVVGPSDEATARVAQRPMSRTSSPSSAFETASRPSSSLRGGSRAPTSRVTGPPVLQGCRGAGR